MSELGDRDISAPPRKRRRPALSCEQCRKRKIKCDRTYPCGQCTQSKTANCSYQEESKPTATPHVDSDVPITRQVVEHRIGPANHIPSAGSTSNSIFVVKHSVTPTFHAAASPLPPSAGANTQQSSTDQQDLLNRIHALEKKLKTQGKKPREKHLQGVLEQKELHGTVSKSRFFGSSHWMHSFGMFERIAWSTVDHKTDRSDFENLKRKELAEGLEKCKKLARRAKSGYHRQWLTSQSFRETFPPRDVCDQLIALYFRTLEAGLRILHSPTFFKEYYAYWDNPAAASTENVLTILLVMSLGVCFYQGADSAIWRSQARHWIFAAQSWLASPYEKRRLHMAGLQIHCLVLLARLDNSVAGDLIWISAGALLRTAFQMGYHRDPKYLPNIKPLDAELRRRLWGTILELNIQSALDSGMSPLMTMEDFDTEIPSNINDSEISEDTKVVNSKPDHIYTQSSIQRVLMRSLAVRLEVIRQANNFHVEPSYEEVLHLGSELSTHCKNNNIFVSQINNASPSAPLITQLRHNLLDTWVRRFLMVLHRPYAIKAQKDPRYYFSRKVCLDCAVTMLTYPSQNPSLRSNLEHGWVDDYTQLMLVSGGFTKELTVHATMIIFAELLTQVEEDADALNQGRAARESLKQIMRNCQELAARRIAVAENNIKGHLFLSIVLAQVEAMERGENPETQILEVGIASVKLCYELLLKRSPDDSTADLDASGSHHGTGCNSIPTPDTSEATSNFLWDFATQSVMQDWTGEFGVPDPWLLSAWEDNPSQ